MNINTWNIRTGSRTYPAVEMPDGTTRAVWRRNDGPDFVGYFTAEPNGEERATTRQDWLDYQARR